MPSPSLKGLQRPCRHLKALPRVQAHTIQTPRRTTRIMHGGAPQIALVLALEGSSASTMHDAGVIPDDEVARIEPRDARDVAVLRSMLHEGPEQRVRLGGRQGLAIRPLQVVQVRGDVEVHAAGGLVALDEAVPMHLESGRVDVVEEGRRRRLAAVVQRVRADEVARH